MFNLFEHPLFGKVNMTNHTYDQISKIGCEGNPEDYLMNLENFFGYYILQKAEEVKKKKHAIIPIARFKKQ